MAFITRVHQSRLDLLDALPKGLVIAELGVFTGDFSTEILQRCQPRMLYLVDTFSGTVSSGDQNGDNVRQVDMGLVHWAVLRKFARHSEVSVVKADSIIWLNDQDSESIDAVYIDTQHTFQRTAGELEESLRVVREGGFVCGHDYSESFPGVIRAVDEICDHFRLPVVIYESDRLPSFRIDKPIQQHYPSSDAHP